jgi:hypothetical protein
MVTAGHIGIGVDRMSQCVGMLGPAPSRDLQCSITPSLCTGLRLRHGTLAKDK